ncbi:MAG: lyase family protein, partial [Alphaproteobacteria bacterium]
MSAKTAPTASKAQQPAADRKDGAANALWGGRFEGAPDALMEAINASIGFDKRLYAHDIAGSKAHAEMLVAQGIIPAEDGRAIAQGLDTILQEIESGAFDFKPALEDIHMNI